jgi:hypothetical protein
MRFIRYSAEKAEPSSSLAPQPSRLETSLPEQSTCVPDLECQANENHRDWRAHTKDLESRIESKDKQIGDLEAILRNKSATLNYIYHSYGIGAFWVCNKMVDKLFPPSSKRRSLARLVLKSIRRSKSRGTNS